MTQGPDDSREETLLPTEKDALDSGLGGATLANARTDARGGPGPSPAPTLRDDSTGLVADPNETRVASVSAETTPRDEELADSAGFVGRPCPGQKIFGRYHVEELIGEGGMGSVWLVRHLELDALRALKLIVPSSAFIPEARARFRREARVMARLTHPNAVVVHDARITPQAAFIEMEYIKGESLNHRLTPGEPMPLDWAARIVVQLCEVLQEAHDRQIVHRDLKPSNLMLLEGRPPGMEHLKVLDFGIAKILEADDGSGELHTQTGSFMGTAQYSSPEQACGDSVDARSDLYSVGVMIYEFVTGRRPFEGPLSRQLYSHLNTPPPLFAVRNPAAAAVPRSVERAVLRFLAKNPADRPQSARELAREFLEALPDDPGAARPRTSATTERAAYHGEPALARTESPFTPYVPSASPDTVTEDANRVEHRPVALPPTTAPLHSPSTSSDLFTATPAAKPGGKTRRGWFVGIGLALALAGGVPAALLLSGKGPRTGWLPDGFRAENSKDLVGTWPRVIVHDVGGEPARFLRIAGGTFRMGDPDGAGDDRPDHPVTLSDYYLQETEVTNGQMEAYFIATHVPVDDRPRRWREAVEKIEKAGLIPKHYPAVGVSHDQAEAFARWVGGKLPTEAQWEYAARSGGKPYPWVWGTERRQIKQSANIESLGSIGAIPTTPTGQYRKDRTEQGVLDLTGNVREWCRDLWAKYAPSDQPATDPEGPKPSPGGPHEFVIRGGSFLTDADAFRTTRPRKAEPDDLTASQLAEDQTSTDLGFRVVIEWPPPPR